MISVEQVTVRFSGNDLFSDITFLVNDNDKIGLTGKNGAGKSTLLKLFMGFLQPDAGQIIIHKDAKLGYLPQQMVCSNDKSIIDETRAAFDELNQIEQKINAINHELTQRTDYESSDYLQLIDRLNLLNDKFNLLGGGNIEADIEQTLIGLGFERNEFDRATSELSGGWRMRIELAKIILQKPDVLLLDEPTNHLDIESIQWLEDFLKNYTGAVILISHDRKFLDSITNRTVEISLGRIYDYPLPYSEYVKQRSEFRKQQEVAYLNQKKKIEETEKFIERFRYKATKAVQVQSRIKQLEKIERIEIDEEDNSAIHFRFPPAPRSGTIVAETKKFIKQYDDKLVLENVDFIIERGEKIAFVGRNGEGKTTFVRSLMNEIDYQGKLKIGHNVHIGYFAQNQDQIMHTNKTVLQTLDDIAVGEVRKEIRNILGAFLFSGEDVEKKVEVLSGGERSRLAIAKLLLAPYNLLILDEPTNHLDMRSKDILKQALLQYDGTLIIVSHDRDFLDGLTDTIYEFKHKKLKQFSGGIYEFLKKKKIDSIKEIEFKDKTNNQTKKTEPSDQKQLYIQRKEFDKKIRKVENQIKQCEQQISDLETLVESLSLKLSDPQGEKINELSKKFGEAEATLENKMETWEKLSHKLENLQQEFQKQFDVKNQNS